MISVRNCSMAKQGDCALMSTSLDSLMLEM
jgi:hypothetical protein